VRVRTTIIAALAGLLWTGIGAPVLADVRHIKIEGDASHIVCDTNCTRFFVTSPSRGSLLVVDVPSERTVQEIKTGKTANHIALAPNRRLLLVLNQDDPSLSLIDLGGLGRGTIAESAVRRLRFDRATTATYVSVVPSPGKEEKAYVSVYDQSKLTGYIAVVDLETATIIKRITYSSFAYNSIGCPYGNAVSEDGRFLYVNVQCVGALGRAGHDPVYVYSTKYDLPVDAISFARHPNVGSGMAVRPGGSEVWAGGGNACNLASYQQQDEARALISGCDGSGRDPITIIDASTNAIRQQIFFGNSAFISFTPDGRYALLPRDNELIMIDAEKREQVGSIDLGGPATGAVAFTLDGKRAFAPVVGKSEVAVFDVPDPSAPPNRLRFTPP
jgi:DNA-binding beta-propeller fold protein YncE